MVYSLKSKRQEFKQSGIFHTEEGLATFVRSFFPENCQEVYDPTCGTGNLLSVFDDQTLKYGQEISQEQLDIAKNNIINFKGVCGDTLIQPAFVDKKFKYIIANPPFSVKWNPDHEDKRYKDLPVFPPKSKADYAFIFHILHYLKDDGLAAVLCAPGVLYRGNAEGKLRQYLINNNLIDKIITIPANSFVDTSISTALILFKKNRTGNAIELVDKETGESKQVSFDEIVKNGYELSVNRYIVKEEIKEKIDPIALHAQARAATIESLKKDLTLDKNICELEKHRSGFSFNEYVAQIQEMINGFK